MLESAKLGLVITRFGQHADIEDPETGQIHRCNLRRGIETLVSGDKVIWRPGNEILAGISGVVEDRKKTYTKIEGLPKERN